MSMIVTDSIAIVVVNEIPPKLPMKIAGAYLGIPTTLLVGC